MNGADMGILKRRTVGLIILTAMLILSSCISVGVSTTPVITLPTLTPQTTEPVNTTIAPASTDNISKTPLPTDTTSADITVLPTDSPIKTTPYPSTGGNTLTPETTQAPLTKDNEENVLNAVYMGYRPMQKSDDQSEFNKSELKYLFASNDETIELTNHKQESICISIWTKV